MNLPIHWQVRRSRHRLSAPLALHRRGISGREPPLAARQGVNATIKVFGKGQTALEYPVLQHRWAAPL